MDEHDENYLTRPSPTSKNLQPLGYEMSVPQMITVGDERSRIERFHPEISELVRMEVPDRIELGQTRATMETLPEDGFLSVRTENAPSTNEILREISSLHKRIDEVETKLNKSSSTNSLCYALVLFCIALPFISSFRRSTLN